MVEILIGNFIAGAQLGLIYSGFAVYFIKQALNGTIPHILQ